MRKLENIIKKLFIVFIVLFFLLLCASVLGLDQKEEYVKIYLIKDPAEKIQALKDYLDKYKDSEFHKNAYVLLVDSYLKIGEEPQAFKYAKKAERYIEELVDKQKAGIYIVLARAYMKRKDKEKKNIYAEKIIRLCKNKQGEIWDSFLSLATNIKKAGEPSPLKKALELYRQKEYQQAEKAFSRLYDLNHTKFQVVNYYAKCLAKNKKVDKALEKFKEAYDLQRNGQVAYNIAIILNSKSKTDKSLIKGTVSYFLRAYLLSPKELENARKIASSLFFNNYQDSETGFSYSALIKKNQGLSQELGKAINEFNKRYEGKEEKEIDEQQMKNDLENIEDLEDQISKMEQRIQKAVEQFNQLFEEIQNEILQK